VSINPTQALTKAAEGIRIPSRYRARVKALLKFSRQTYRKAFAQIANHKDFFKWPVSCYFSGCI
jgi:hypothetical protein